MEIAADSRKTTDTGKHQSLGVQFMQRIYRGIAYTASPQQIATVETETFAKFRGSTYRVRRPIDPSTPTRHNLVYRGVAYQSQSEGVRGTLPVFG